MVLMLINAGYSDLNQYDIDHNRNIFFIIHNEYLWHWVKYLCINILILLARSLDYIWYGVIILFSFELIKFFWEIYMEDCGKTNVIVTLF